MYEIEGEIRSWCADEHAHHPHLYCEAQHTEGGHSGSGRHVKGRHVNKEEAERSPDAVGGPKQTGTKARNQWEMERNPKARPGLLMPFSQFPSICVRIP